MSAAIIYSEDSSIFKQKGPELYTVFENVLVCNHTVAFQSFYVHWGQCLNVESCIHMYLSGLRFCTC